MVSVSENIKSCLLEIKGKYHICAIYGTGLGAEKIWKEVTELKLQQSIKYIFDRGCAAKLKFHGYEIKELDIIPNDLEVIFIGAELNHYVIEQRILKLLDRSNRRDVVVVNPFSVAVSQEDKDEFLAFIDDYRKFPNDFVPICEDDYTYVSGDAKVIAWYLPQFHQMEINNKYHGQGFTEWTNTSRTLPQFMNHYQPHVPYDVGYYDIMNPDTLKRQAFLAKKYGIYGFGFFYYWFSGKRIMEKPLLMLLEHKEIDIHFCLHWATDNWSASWYSGKPEVIMKQEIPNADAYWTDIKPFFEDERYIKINGKPVFIVYKCVVFEKQEFNSFIDGLRRCAVNDGYPDIFVMISTGDGMLTDYKNWNGDALVEYQPWRLYQSKMIENVIPTGYRNPNFKAYFSSLERAIEKKEYLLPYNVNKYFRSALVSWDNSARKKESLAIVMTGITPEKTKQWLADIMRESKRIHNEEENIVFISSWNEWAEGSHLEPDHRYGYAWLNAVKEAHILARDGKV